MSPRAAQCSIRNAAFLFLILSSVFFPALTIGQNVAINNDASSPDPSALLDVKSTTKGILVPRMTSAQRTAIVSPFKGLLVFDNNTNSFWFYSGSAWVSLSNLGSQWSVTGNSGTDSTINFIGTTDTHPIVLKVNNQKAGLIGASGSVFLGLHSGNSNTSGYSNVAIGSGALLSNTDRPNTVAIGDSALASNGVGAATSADAVHNTAVGSKALEMNTTGSGNTAMGYQSLNVNVTGSSNTSMGYQSLAGSYTGSDNTAIGYQALLVNSGSSNTGLGSRALFFSNSSSSFNTAVGASAGLNAGGTNNTAVGYLALHDNISGNSNVAIGTNALDQNSDRSNLVAIGDSALFYNGSGATPGSTEALKNTAVGSKALFSNTTGNSNTALGFQSLYSLTTNIRNTAVGSSALFALTDGLDNTAIGNAAMSNITTGAGNTGIGSGALRSSAGSFNTAVGDIAMVSGSGSNNTAIGYNTLALSLGGNNVTVLGANATTSLTAPSNATAIGAQSQVNCSNCLVLGSVAGVNGASSSVHVGIGITSPTLPLSFPATLEKKISLYPGATGDAGLGVFGNELRINSDYVGADITFGYDDRTNGFTENMRVRGNGNVGIGTNNPSQKLTVNGNICYTGTIGACSDIRYKENITPLQHPLSSILSMNGFYYNWKKEGFPGMSFSDDRQIGFSAQEVEKQYPEIVMTDANGYKSVDYGRLSPVLVEAIKEQQQEIKELQEQVKMLVKEKRKVNKRLIDQPCSS